MRKDNIFPIILIPLCCIGILVATIYIATKDTTIKIKVNGIKKTIGMQGKTFEQICEDSSGFWMDASMGMTETRGGVSINTNKCSGCMPNNKNMFCNKDDYVNYIKINGVDTSDFNMKSMNKGMDMK